MAGKTDCPPGKQAVDTLQNLGLTECQARCFVALVRVPSATGKDVSRIADVPYTRVYNTVENLKDEGLVEVQETDPREFRAQPTTRFGRSARSTSPDSKPQNEPCHRSKPRTTLATRGRGRYPTTNR
jgi:hypothetical protein